MITFRISAAICGGCLLLMSGGCGSDESAPVARPAAEGGGQPAADAPRDRPENSSGGGSVAERDSPGGPPRREFRPVRLGGSASDTSATAGGGAATGSGDPHSNPAFAKLKDLQIVLGEWRGTTRRKFGDFNALETVRWKWDLLTDKSQPALVFDTTDSPYFQAARLTYDATAQHFRLAATDKDGVKRVYEGTYTQEPQLVAGDDPNKLQRVFKLQLDQIEPADDRELARVVLNQQNNNRYLVEIYRRSGERVVIHDTIANQREGTSFALIDEGYGERTCVISEGLGTMTVTHNGRTYYVCCTGCQAAFNENPEYWIAKAEERRQAGGE